jgi:hypothetical protein
MTLIMMILVCVIGAISILLYLLHWCHQKHKVFQADVTDDLNNSSRQLAKAKRTQWFNTRYLMRDIL